MEKGRDTVRKPKARQYLSPAVLCVFLICAAALPLLMGGIKPLWIAILMYIVLSVSWSVFAGATGHISLATAAFFGLGMYTAAFFSDNLPLPLLMLAGGAITFCAAFAIGAVMLRFRGLYFTIITFILVEALKYLIIWAELRFADKHGRFIEPLSAETVYYYILALAAILIAVVYIIKRPRFGRVFPVPGAVTTAAAPGRFSPALAKAFAFAISSFFMGAVGAAVAAGFTYIDPATAFDELKTFLPVLMAVFGGMRKPVGPVVGAAVFAWLQEVLGVDMSAGYLIAVGAILIAIIVFMPEGLVGLLHAAAGKIASVKMKTTYTADSGEEKEIKNDRGVNNAENSQTSR